MSIQTTQFLGNDGKPMTPDQAEVMRLKKSDAATQEKLAALEQRLSDLESKIEQANCDKTIFPE
jgi:ubiquinone biosynthesis protein UbiJ